MDVEANESDDDYWWEDAVAIAFNRHFFSCV
jgi:hypothetical protein